MRAAWICPGKDGVGAVVRWWAAPVPGLGCADLIICLATGAEGLCWGRDNIGRKPKTGLDSWKSSLVRPMRSVSKDFVGLNRRNSGQIMRLTSGTQRTRFLWIQQMKRKSSLFLSLVGRQNIDIMHSLSKIN